MCVRKPLKQFTYNNLTVKTDPISQKPNVNQVKNIRTFPEQLHDAGS